MIDTLMQSISPNLDLLTIVAGVVTACVIAAIGQVLSGSREKATYKRRMAMVKSDRAGLKAAHLTHREKRERDEKTEKRLEEALGKLKLQQQLDDPTLKARLIKAGIRRRRDQLTFLAAQVGLPPFLGAAAIGVFEVALKPEGVDWTVYACVAVGGVIVGYLLPGMRVDGMAQDRQKQIERALPDALDLLTICVESGMSVEQSISRVASELGPHATVLSEELELLTAELSYLGDRRQAFDNFVARTQTSSVKTVISALVQAEKYGTPIGQALRVISAESRFNRMAAAETKAASLPAKLTVPMMVFFVPALFVIILGPAILQMMDSF